MIQLKWAQGANPGTPDLKKASNLTDELRIIHGLELTLYLYLFLWKIFHDYKRGML